MPPDALSSPAPAYSLSDSAYCRQFEDGAIVLDLHSGSYIGIDAENLPSLRANVRNWPGDGKLPAVDTDPARSSSSTLIGNLIARGILTTSAVDERYPSDIECSDALPHFDNAGHRFRVSVIDVGLFAISFLLVKWHLRSNRLPYLISLIKRRQTLLRKASPTPISELARTLGSFMRLRIWFFSAYQHCLLDSLILSEFLTLRSIRCAFVIGVTTKPFLAHAWVQTGGCILNDTAEHVQMFHTIVVVGHRG